MIEWQPIESAPLDGTRVLISDGKLMTAAEWMFYEERATTSLGYGSPEDGIPLGGVPRVPGQEWSIEQVANPRAGERHYFWCQDNPIAFAGEDAESPDYDGNFEQIKPTHWAPLPAPPCSDSDTSRMAETGTGSGRSRGSAGRQASPDLGSPTTIVRGE